MDGIKELINCHYDHAALGVEIRNGKYYLWVAGSYFSEEAVISKELYDLLLAELEPSEEKDKPPHS